jgi:hypothetical protein
LHLSAERERTLSTTIFEQITNTYSYKPLLLTAAARLQGSLSHQQPVTTHTLIYHHPACRTTYLALGILGQQNAFQNSKRLINQSSVWAEKAIPWMAMNVPMPMISRSSMADGL